MIMIPPNTNWSLTARWIVPVAGPPLPDGVVHLQGSTILRVEPAGGQRADLDLGDAIVLPGLVNAHVHLDLSGFQKPVPYDGDFTRWLRAVVAHRQQAAPPAEQVASGLAESLVAGVTLLGDITHAGQSWPILAGAPLWATVFHEVLGLTHDRAATHLASLQDWLSRRPDASNLQVGLSPHAPYSTRRSLYRDLADIARRHDFPLTTHLGETQEELELLQSHTGPFRSFLEEINLWDPRGLVRDPADVVEICRPVPQVLLAHGTYLDPGLLGGWTGTVVFCPRTHAHFRQKPHPFRQLLAQGTRVAIGTDGRSSNPDLSVLNEIRYFHQQYPDVDPAVLIRMATLSGAEALGWSGRTGSLEPGKSADLIVVPMTGTTGDPCRLLLESTVEVQRVLFAGQWRSGFHRQVLPSQIRSPQKIILRPVGAEDVPTLYNQQIDEESNRMAAVNSRDQPTFEAHWARVLDDSTMVIRGIWVDGQLAGCIGCFLQQEVRHLGYWLGKEFWGHGIATAAVQLLLQEIPDRPLHATVASHNLASLRILQRSGFRITGRRHSPGNERYRECEEIQLRLD